MGGDPPRLPRRILLRRFGVFFGFFTYQMLAAGSGQMLVDVARGALMLGFAMYVTSARVGQRGAGAHRPAVAGG